ncbi:hypothetical protein Ait01nite_070080 [Actinoplanes italicus]|uniref:Uncharacterized protein n=1 Tax=Actinoplanes italicus TaxID=113567 RepID=A0A2T0JV43_9ACTN|nr:hypothetical protein [Actinoplanes italicus]PRX11508.1 hypothetical protein CLV67_13184 [Actinoplanes italicus]GIE33963.1 hypothetical protein Ait01nite_070080 [Actinoplanes italicus]
MTATFAPVALPSDLDGIAAWIDSEAMAALLAEFRHEPLPTGSLGDRLAALEAVSARCWDYRKGLERHQATGETFSPERTARIEAAATALGLLGHRPPPADDYDHILVLGGGVRTMLARADLAADLARQGVSTTTIAGLGSVRPLDNPAQVAQELGLPESPTEGDAVEVGLRRALRLGQPPSRRSGVSDTGQPWWIRSYEDTRPPVHVLAAPSTRPGMRANTGDTFIGWAELVEPRPEGARLLLVTTDIFVPFQHCDAVRLLTLQYRCHVDTVGFDTRSNPWVKTPETFQVLQEVRSAVRSMQALHSALDGEQAAM